MREKMVEITEVVLLLIVLVAPEIMCSATQALLRLFVLIVFAIIFELELQRQHKAQMSSG